MFFGKTIRQLYAEAHDDGGQGGGSGGGDKGQDKGAGSETGDDKSDNKGDDSQGKGVIDDEKAKLIKDVMKFKTQSREAAKALEELKTQIEQLQVIKDAAGDLTPDQIKVLATERKERERVELEKKGEYERIVKAQKEENEQAVAALQAKLDELTGELSKKTNLVEDLTVGRAFRDSEFVREKSTLPASIAQREFGENFEVVSGSIVGYDKPRGANERTPLVDANGEFLSFEQAISRLFEKHPEAKTLVRSTRKTGAGSTTEKGTQQQKATGDQARGLGRIVNALDKKQQ